MRKIYFIFFLIACILGMPSYGLAYVSFDTPSAPYPQTSFNFSPAQPQVNQSVQFNDSTTCYIGVDASGNPIVGPCVSWQWNFGDGNMSNSINPTHSYSSSGGFNTTLFVTSVFGDACFYSMPVNVQSGLGGPTPSGAIKKPIYKEVSPK